MHVHVCVGTLNFYCKSIGTHRALTLTKYSTSLAGHNAPPYHTPAQTQASF